MFFQMAFVSCYVFTLWTLISFGYHVKNVWDWVTIDYTDWIFWWYNLYQNEIMNDKALFMISGKILLWGFIISSNIAYHIRCLHISPRYRVSQKKGRSQNIIVFHELLSLGCINLKNLCAHQQEEVLRFPKETNLQNLHDFMPSYGTSKKAMFWLPFSNLQSKLFGETFIFFKLP